MVTKKELEEIKYWDLQKKYPQYFEVGIDKPELIDAIIRGENKSQDSLIPNKDFVNDLPKEEILNSVPELSTSGGSSTGKSLPKRIDLRDWVNENMKIFPDNSVVEIIANSILPRVEDIINIMNQCQRILKPGKCLLIRVPLFPNPESVQDPTVKNFFTQRSFNYYVESNHLYKSNGKNYGIAPFKHISQRVEGWELVVTLTK